MVRSSSKRIVNYKLYITLQNKNTTSFLFLSLHDISHFSVIAFLRAHIYYDTYIITYSYKLVLFQSFVRHENSF